MAKSQQTFGKSEREKKRIKKRKDKQLKKEERKASGVQNSEFVYVDEFGQLTDTPPDPSKKVKVDAASIEIGVPKKEDREVEDPVKKGKVSFFDSSKGFGFIIENDIQNEEEVKAFDVGGYYFSPNDSSDLEYVFLRDR